MCTFPRPAHLLLEHRLQGRVNALPNILNQDRIAQANGILQHT